MNEQQDLILYAAALAKAQGFDAAAPLDCSTIVLLDEVRAMCAENVCGMYGHNWACPPGCGSLDACREKLAGYTSGILVQTIGELEDSLDYEGMMAAQKRHQENFSALCETLRSENPELLALGAGCCTICAKCTCPDQPCRFPEKRISSMEAYGIMVNDICKANGLSYYYGTDKISYTSCFLLVKH